MVFDGSDSSFFWSDGPETGSIWLVWVFYYNIIWFILFYYSFIDYSIFICSFWSAIGSTFDVSLGGGALASAYFDSEQTSQ